MFMAYDFAHIMYMDISVFWNSMELSNNSNWPFGLVLVPGTQTCHAMPSRKTRVSVGLTDKC